MNRGIIKYIFHSLINVDIKFRIYEFNIRFDRMINTSCS